MGEGWAHKGDEVVTSGGGEGWGEVILKGVSLVVSFVHGYGLLQGNINC